MTWIEFSTVLEWLTVFALLGIAVLIIHKLTVGRVLRIIGNAFIAAGDAVDHFVSRFRHLKIQEREMRGDEA